MDIEKTVAFVNPRLLAEWSERNEKSPFEVSAGSHKKAWWICPKGHEWQAVIRNRAKNGYGCPYCSGRAVKSGVNDLEKINPKLAEEWSILNGDLKSTDFTAHSNKKVWWNCSEGHSWQARIADRTSGSGCPICAGKLQTGFNDLATTYPEISAEWSEDNELAPTEVTDKSRLNVKWNCSTRYF